MKFPILYDHGWFVCLHLPDGTAIEQCHGFWHALSVYFHYGVRL